MCDFFALSLLNLSSFVRKHFPECNDSAFEKVEGREICQADLHRQVSFFEISYPHYLLQAADYFASFAVLILHMI